MNLGTSRRRVVILLIGLAVIAVAVWAAVRLLGGQISYTDHSVDIEVILVAPPPAVPATN